MQALVADRLEEIAELCRRHHVKRLALFGSAARDDFDPERSDVDLLVEFQSFFPGYARNYFALQHSFSELFCRPADLLEFSSIRNPYLSRLIEQDSRVLYAAA